MPTAETMAKVTTELFNEERSTAANGSGAVSQTLDYKNLKGLPVHETSNSSGIESGVLESSNQSSELSALDSTTSSQLPDIAALENIQFELDKLQDTVNSTDISEVETIVVTATSQGETSHSGDSLQEIPPGASLLTGTVSNSGQISAKSLLNTSGNTGSSIGSEATATVLPGQTLLKRPGAPGQVVTKVIITKNPGTVCGRTQAMQTGAAATGTSEIVLSAPATSQLLGVNTGTSITLTQANLLSSPTRLATATTPTKVILTSKSLTTGKSPTKIAIPINPQSPQRILQSGQFKIVSAQSVGGATSTVTPGGIQPKKLTFSPQKVIIRPQQPGATGGSKPVMVQQLNAPRQQSGTVAAVPNLQPLLVTGSKFQYMRLATTRASQAQTAAPAGTRTVTMPSIAPAPSTVQAKSLAASAPVGAQSLITSQATQQPQQQQQQQQQPTQMKISMPVGQNQQQVISRPVTQNTASTQRIILPATSQPSLAPIRPAGSQQGFTQLPPGTTIISGGQNLGGVQGFALVPAQYVTQLNQLSTPSASAAQTRQESGYVPIASTNPAVSASTTRPNVNGDAGAPARVRKPCNCTKSQCLKLYCDCFANGEFCHNCNCAGCANNLEHEEERSRAIKACLDRNPFAFHPKIGKGRGGTGTRRHNKGCNCKRSGCLKNYCECYEAKIMCSNLCKCVGCKNFEESADRKTLMHLADAAEVRVQQQTAAKTKLSSQIQDVPVRVSQVEGERLPYTFVTREVAEATCACLMAQAEEAERTRQMDVIQERMVLEEFGRCLMQVIESAQRTRAPSPLP